MSDVEKVTYFLGFDYLTKVPKIQTGTKREIAETGMESVVVTIPRIQSTADLKGIEESLAEEFDCQAIKLRSVSII